VSIVLLTRNGMDTLPEVRGAIKRQQCTYQFEVIAVDSASTDGTRALLDREADRVISIAPGQFDHGLTRNLGIAQSRGDFIVLLVQDATPASDAWLQALVDPLQSNPTLAGTFARQVPRADASALARHYLALWVAASDTARTVALSGPAELEAMTPMDRYLHCAFDNVCACIRRSVWADHPFLATPIAEDVAWGREVLLAGHRLAFVPDSVVLHSHDRSLAYEFRRTRDLHDRLFDLFGLRTIPAIPHLARAIAASSIVNVRCEMRRPWHTPRAIGLAVVSPLGQYLGARRSSRRLRTTRTGAGECVS
jgi:rhamnosyltransferase